MMRVKTKKFVVTIFLLTACTLVFTNYPGIIGDTHASGKAPIRRFVGQLTGLFETKPVEFVNNIVFNQSVSVPTWRLFQPSDEAHSLDDELPLFSNYTHGNPRVVKLFDKSGAFFTKGNCLAEGTLNWSNVCHCKTGWHGEFCSIPNFIDETTFRNYSGLSRSSRPRRLIYGMPFNMEFELLEIRLGEAGDLIDAIIIVESNYTGYGKPKKLNLLEKLKHGFLKEHQHKIVYLFMDFFPTGTNPKDGAFTDFYTKNYVGREGLQFIEGRRDDDIFIMCDADEIHRREALLFLKLHNNYPEPVGGIFRRNVFGFYWSSGFTNLGFACSLRMLHTVYDNNCSELRGATSSQHKYLSALKEYDKKWHNAQMWNMGELNSVSKIAGWHCSWCFSPERIKIKLLSAYNYDFPRWGDYPEKTELNYIHDLIKVGLWFDDKSTYLPQYVTKHAPYAPRYAFKHAAKFNKILFNPFLDL